MDSSTIKRISYQSFLQEQKIKMQTKYPFLSKSQINKKVKEKWGKLDTIEKQCYTKTILSPSKYNKKQSNMVKSKVKSPVVSVLSRYQEKKITTKQTTASSEQECAYTSSLPRQIDDEDEIKSPQKVPTKKITEDSFTNTCTAVENVKDAIKQKPFVHRTVPWKGRSYKEDIWSDDSSPKTRRPPSKKWEKKSSGILKPSGDAGKVEAAKKSQNRVSFSSPTDGQASINNSFSPGNHGDSCMNEISDDEDCPQLLRRTDDDIIDFETIEDFTLHVEEDDGFTGGSMWKTHCDEEDVRFKNETGQENNIKIDHSERKPFKSMNKRGKETPPIWEKKESEIGHKEIITPLIKDKSDSKKLITPLMDEELLQKKLQDVNKAPIKQKRKDLKHASSSNSSTIKTRRSIQSGLQNDVIACTSDISESPLEMAEIDSLTSDETFNGESNNIPEIQPPQKRQTILPRKYSKKSRKQGNRDMQKCEDYLNENTEILCSGIPVSSVEKRSERKSSLCELQGRKLYPRSISKSSKLNSDHLKRKEKKNVSINKSSGLKSLNHKTSNKIEESPTSSSSTNSSQSIKGKKKCKRSAPYKMMDADNLISEEEESDGVKQKCKRGSLSSKMSADEDKVYSTKDRANENNDNVIPDQFPFLDIDEQSSNSVYDESIQPTNNVLMTAILRLKKAAESSFVFDSSSPCLSEISQVSSLNDSSSESQSNNETEEENEMMMTSQQVARTNTLGTDVNNNLHHTENNLISKDQTKKFDPCSDEAESGLQRQTDVLKMFPEVISSNNIPRTVKRLVASSKEQSNSNFEDMFTDPSETFFE